MSEYSIKTGKIKTESKKETAKDKDRTLLDQVDKYRSSSDNMLSSYHQRWSKNLKLKFGIFSENTKTTSKVRNVSKIFFRKIWATEWRLVASFYNAFMRDPDSYKIEGRDKTSDWQPAGVLQEMTEYRKDQMMRKNSLFIKHIWAFQDILDHGICFGKMRWVYDGDRPDYILYPVEQVKPDLSADTPEGMRFCIFDNFMTKAEMENAGYENIGEAEPSSIPYNQISAVRHNIHKDPMQNYSDTEYPQPGAFTEEKKSPKEIYIASEVFYIDDGEMKLCVVNGNKCVLQQPEKSPYGDRIPLVMGQCLTVPHRLIGEGLAEPLEGPQESYNYNLNMRKDNVALALNKQTIVSRFGNVDLQSLVNSKAGGITLADDPTAVVERQMADVTQSSYAEAMADAGMMDEMSGITPGKRGMGTEEKATVAQINYSESNAKIDLLIALVGETYWRSFHSQLAYMIQTFETDENVFRIANASFRQKQKLDWLPDEYNLDFDADCVVLIGPGTVGREFEIRQTLLAMDRAAMGNQATGALLQMGVIAPEDALFVNTQALMEDLLPKLGKKSVERYFIKAQQPQGQGGQNPALAGRGAPQVGMPDNMIEWNGNQ